LIISPEWILAASSVLALFLSDILIGIKIFRNKLWQIIEQYSCQDTPPIEDKFAAFNRLVPIKNRTYDYREIFVDYLVFTYEVVNVFISSIIIAAASIFVMFAYLGKFPLWLGIASFCGSIVFLIIYSYFLSKNREVIFFYRTKARHTVRNVMQIKIFPFIMNIMIILIPVRWPAN